MLWVRTFSTTVYIYVCLSVCLFVCHVLKSIVWGHWIPWQWQWNDNDNDNEIIFIAKWHTDHVQRTWVKNRSGRNDIHEIYKTCQRGLKPWWLMCPNINYTKQIVWGVQNRNSAECWSSSSIKHVLSCACIPTYIPRMAHMCIYMCMFTHLYIEKASLPLMLPCINIAESCNKVIVWKQELSLDAFLEWANCTFRINIIKDIIPDTSITVT